MYEKLKDVIRKSDAKKGWQRCAGLGKSGQDENAERKFSYQ